MAGTAQVFTNAYVVTDERTVRDAFGSPDPKTLRAHFTTRNHAGRGHQIASILFTSPPNALDVSIARLDPPPVIEQPVQLADRLPERGSAISVVGHPLGGTLQLTDARLVDADDIHLHYSAPTEPGSSGSAIFNPQWEIIGIHHAAGDLPRLHGQPGRYAVSEGISILAIVQHLRGMAKRPGPQPARRQRKPPGRRRKG